MYKLLGADKKEYGPVSADKIRTWMTQGRANARTKLQSAGSTAWKPLAEFPEFAADLRPAKGAAAPTPPATGTRPAAGPAKISGLAVASLVVSGLAATSRLLGCPGLSVCIMSLIGLVLGIIALVHINKSNAQLGGRGLALAGTIISAVFIVLGLILCWV